jgi:hypothetical protein
MLRDWLTKLLCPQHIASPPGRDATIAAETADVAPINAFYYEVAMMKLQSQFQEIRAIDTRSTSYFTIGSAILPIVAGFLAADQGLIARPPLADLALVDSSAIDSWNADWQEEPAEIRAAWETSPHSPACCGEAPRHP